MEETSAAFDNESFVAFMGMLSALTGWQISDEDVAELAALLSSIEVEETVLVGVPVSIDGEAQEIDIEIYLNAQDNPHCFFRGKPELVELLDEALDSFIEMG